MGRYTGPAHRQNRREGAVLDGHRITDKHEKRLTKVPGMHPQGRKKLSDYGMQFREKQKMKRIYGLLERQFRIFFDRAVQKKGITGETLIQLLEQRLDNTVFRLRFAATRREARQMVGHGLIFVNGKRVDIPSYMIKVGDKISPISKEKNMARVKARLEQFQDIQLPEWLSINPNTLEATVLRLPLKADAGLPVDESQIVELYSK